MSPPMRMRKVEDAACACKRLAGKIEAAPAAPICDRNRRLPAEALGLSKGPFMGFTFPFVV